MKPWIGVLPMAVLVLAAGCLSTPERRIARDPARFATYPADVQARIRQGIVEVGDTPEMVRFALGDPSRIHSRLTAEGETEIWTYTGLVYDSAMVPASYSQVYRDRHGRVRRTYETGWFPVDTAREYPVLRLEFEGGKVKVIEKAR